MSTPIKKKNRKKKKKNKDEDGDGPKRHERIGNLNYYSEEISKFMIEKIISLALSDDFRKNIEKKLNNFCYDSMVKTFDNLTQLININHDIDDFDVDNIEIAQYIKYNKSDTNIKRYLKSKHNTAIEARNNKAEQNIMELAKIPKDFKTYMNIKNKKIEDCLNKSAIIEKNKYIKKPKLYQYNIHIEKKNFWGIIPSPEVCDIDRTTSNFNSYIPKKVNPPKNNIISPAKKEEKLPEKNIQKKSSFNYKNFISKLSKNISIFKGIKETPYEDILTKKKKVQMVEYPSFPLDNNNDLRKEPEEILILRKNTIDMMILKEKEMQRELLKQMKKKKEAENAKKQKKGRFTYDNEGKLMQVNEIKEENLLNEFWPVMCKQKDIKKGKSIESYKKETEKLENHAKKNIIYNDEENQFLNTFMVKARLSEPLVILNEFKKSILKNNFSNKQVKQRRRFDEFFFDRINKQKIEPSGSNFQLMNPSVGVKIKEKTFEKSGGNDYFKEFHKYSIDEFNKTLQDTIEWTKYKQKDKEKENDGSKTTMSFGLQNFKKININEKPSNESKSIINPKNNHNKKRLIRLRRNLKNKNIKDSFGKTFTTGFYTNQNKYSLLKSSSEIVIDNKKYINLKEILFHNDTDKNLFNKITPDNKRSINNMFLFNQNRYHSSIRKNSKLIEVTKMFNDVDTLNRELITGKAHQQRIFHDNYILPKIPNKNNDINFNRTMINFNRERTKKSNWEDYVQKKESTKNIKKIKRFNSVKID